MKKMRMMVAVAAFMALATACADDDGNALNNAQQQQEVMAAVQSGTWRITSFVDSGNDETNHFQGYVFTFAANGTLTASNGGTAYSGTWAVTDENSSDDHPDDIDLYIHFSQPEFFTDLNEDWDISARTDNEITLHHVSGGNGGTDTLVFKKN